MLLVLEMVKKNLTIFCLLRKHVFQIFNLTNYVLNLLVTYKCLQMVKKPVGLGHLQALQWPSYISGQLNVRLQ